MAKKNKRNELGLTLFIVVMVAALIIAVFFKITKRNDNEKLEAEANMTEAEVLIAKNLETDYPQTPREVVKLYGRIVKCLYSGSLDDSQIEKLVDQLRNLYSDQLLDANPREDMAEFTKSDIAAYAEAKKTINSCTVEEAAKIKTVTTYDRQTAYVHLTFTIKEDSKFVRSYEEFILINDAGGDWKILGWKMTDGGTEE